MADSKKLAANRRGQFSETVAAFYLRLKGYRILERQYRTPVGEIDIIARRGNTVAFIEVKARQDIDAAQAAISPHQQSRIIRASGWFLQKNQHLTRCDLRFDALLMAPGRWPRHMLDAWQG